MSLQFTAFDIYYHSTCDYDHLTINDGDGTTLMEKSCGSSYIWIGGQNTGSSLPTAIKSTSNTVKLEFVTNGAGTRTGWNVSWSAVTPGDNLSFSSSRC